MSGMGIVFAAVAGAFLAGAGFDCAAAELKLPISNTMATSRLAAGNLSLFLKRIASIEIVSTIRAGFKTPGGFALVVGSRGFETSSGGGSEEFRLRLGVGLKCVVILWPCLVKVKRRRDATTPLA